MIRSILIGVLIRLFVYKVEKGPDEFPLPRVLYPVSNVNGLICLGDC